MKNSTIKGALLLLPLYLLSCSNSEKGNSATTTTTKLGSTQIAIDTVFLDLDLFSTDGYFRLLDNAITYIQASEQNAHVFDMSGKLTEKKLGTGEGPSEANGDLSYHIQKPNGKHVFLGSSYVFKTYNTTLDEIEGKITFTWGNRKPKYNTAILDDPGLYSYNYRDEPYLDAQWLPITEDNKIIIPVVINNHRNGVASVQENSRDYFNNAFMLGAINLNTGVLEKVFHEFPKSFTSFSGFPYFYNYTYRFISNGELFVSDRLNKNISIYDAKTLTLKSTFGVNGQYYNQEVDHYRNYEEFLSGISVVNTLLSSYYLNIYADEDYIFRSYHVADFEPWGLQIYDRESKELLSDTRVPFRFNVIGKIDGYYYADGIRDEETETLAAYKFKLN